MMNFEELLKLIKLNESDQGQKIFNSDDSSYDIYMESVYDSILSSIINKAKNDAGNYDELNRIKNIKKDISNETKKQYKIIISFCKESEIPKLKTALKKYNFLHFLKFVVRIIDVDEEYDLKVNECKKYFSNPETIKIYQYLYKHNKVPLLELKSLTETNYLSPASSNLYDLIIINEENDKPIYSLSPKGINLFAFFMMKNINIDGIDTNYNESKVNEILEYLIQYISTQTKKEREQIKKPILNSSSARYNLGKLTYLLEYKENSYYQSFNQPIKNQEPNSYNWIGGRPWKTF